MSIYKPYTYLIGWSSLGVWYYGVEYGELTKTANPANLWSEYFTSSKQVKCFREQHGEPDVLQVRRVFDTAEKACIWERKVLTRMKVLDHPNVWLNRNVAGVAVMNEEIAQKISRTMRGRIPKNIDLLHQRTMSAEERNAHSLRMIADNPSKKEEVKALQRERLKGTSFFSGKKHSEKTKQMWSEKRKGLRRSPESIEKQRLKAKGKVWITNSVLNKKIKIEDFSFYEKEGWVRGMKSKFSLYL